VWGTETKCAVRYQFVSCPPAVACHSFVKCGHVMLPKFLCKLAVPGTILDYFSLPLMPGTDGCHFECFTSLFVWPGKKLLHATFMSAIQGLQKIVCRIFKVDCILHWPSLLLSWRAMVLCILFCPLPTTSNKTAERVIQSFKREMKAGARFKCTFWLETGKFSANVQEHMYTSLWTNILSYPYTYFRHTLYPVPEKNRPTPPRCDGCM